MKARLLSQPAILSPLTRTSLVACASLCAVTTSAFAAPQTWDGEVDATWVNATNWVANAVPGSTTTTSNDQATFSSALVGGTRGGVTDPVTIDLNRRIGLIRFDTANVGAYVIGATGGNPLLLSAQNIATPNSVTMTDTVAVSQTLAGPLKLTQPSSQSDNYAFINNSTTTGANLIISGNLDATNTTRTWQIILDGTNTGNNIISGNINNTTTTGNGGAGPIQKNGVGRWILSGTNIFIGNTSGGNNVHAIVTNGAQVNAGTLVVQNNLAFGNTANAKVFVNGGVLELDANSANGSLTLENNLIVTIGNTATVRSKGTNAVNSRVSLSAAAAVSGTLSTVNAADVFTIGNAANDFTGGAADTVLHVAGPGAVVLSQNSNYLGSVSVDEGTLRLGSDTALGTQGSVNVATGAKLQLNGGSTGGTPTLTTLTGSGAVENSTALDATLTTNIAVADTFAGALQNGTGGGALALTKTGAGTLNLSGASTYTGATTLTTGSINLTGSLGNTAVSLPANAVLSGSGSIAGSVAAATGSHVAPGDGGDTNIGTLSTGSLSLDSGSQLDFGITNTTTLDKINVTTSGGLTINGGQININGGAGAFTTNGTYNLIAYSGAISGSGVSSLSINDSNKSPAKTYTLGASGGFITLTVANSAVVQKFWNVNADGSWGTAGSWTPTGAPNASGAIAAFGGGGTEITADRTITVNGAFTVGTIAFNGAANAKNYTFAAGSGASLTLNNGASAAFITNSSGSHIIGSPVTLTGNGAAVTVTNAADIVTISGVIDGNGSPLTKGGAGKLILSGVNTYFNGTTVNAGTLEITNDLALGDPVNSTTINAGTLRSTADFTSTGSFYLGSGTSNFSVASGTTHTITGSIMDGASTGTLNKSGTGTLALNGFNSYTGGSVINNGKVQINSIGSLGDSAGSVTINAATLEATASFTGTRSVVLGNAASLLQAETGVTYTISGPISGTGTLNKIGAGTVSLGSNTNSYTGGTVIQAGTLAVNNTSFIMGTLTFQGGTLQNNYGNNNGYFFGNPITIATGQTGTINMNNRMSLGAGAVITGAGTLNINANTTVARDDFSNNWAGFTGQLNIAGSGTVRLLNNGGSFNTGGFANCSVDLAGTVLLEPSNNSNGNTYTIGSLSSASATAGIKGPSQGGATTLSVGGLNTSTTFAGGTLVGHLTKVGSGTLTLTNTTPTGNVTVTTGTLSLPSATLADNAIVSVSATNGSFINLNYVGTDSIDDLVIDGVMQADGEWGAIGSGAAHETDRITGTGRLLVLPEDPFINWISGFAAVGTLNAKTDDPDHDGLTNLDEFALDGNPAVGGATGKVRSRVEAVGADQALVITLPVRTGAVFAGTPSKAATIDDTIYTIEGSNNLGLYDQGVTEITASSVGMPALTTGWTYRTFRLDGAVGGATPRGPKGFLRITIADAP
ncbi:beta strand repeat-containing protein [Luteolibacter soli]|uniref:Autotransporter-associated beta strand repeat-containing protein n=1 Tax=Luteolibacter soli TaxID=3135280 RepID=A0ABU9AYD5_9BACT